MSRYWSGCRGRIVTGDDKGSRRASGPVELLHAERRLEIGFDLRHQRGDFGLGRDRHARDRDAQRLFRLGTLAPDLGQHVDRPIVRLLIGVTLSVRSGGNERLELPSRRPWRLMNRAGTPPRPDLLRDERQEWREEA